MKEKLHVFKLILMCAGLYLCVLFAFSFQLDDRFQMHTELVEENIYIFGVSGLILLLISLWGKGNLSPISNKGEKKFLLFILILNVITVFLVFQIESYLLLRLTLFVFLILNIFNYFNILTLKRWAYIVAWLFLAFSVLSYIVDYSCIYSDSLTEVSAGLISWILKFFNFNANSNNGILLVESKYIYLDPVKTGLFINLFVFVIFSIPIILSQISLFRKICAELAGLLLSFVFFVLRCVFIIKYAPELEYAGITLFNLYLYSDAFKFFAYIIVGWVPIYYFSGINFKNLVPVSNQEKYYSYIIAGVILLLFGTGFNFFGTPAQKATMSIYIDEIHSRWELTTVDYDYKLTGTLAENNYHSFLTYLSRRFRTGVISDIAKPAALRNIDPYDKVEWIESNYLNKKVLSSLPKDSAIVIKCMTKPFTREEIKDILAYVKNGGCLFLIGDHTDVYHMNTYLNPLAKHFGMQFTNDATYFIDGGWIITDKRHTFNHLAVKNLDLFIFATGDSVKVKPPAFPLVRSPISCFADIMYKYNEYFFGNRQIDINEKHGSHVLIAGATYGKGKIVAFTDSTCFNNYIIHSNGRHELIESMMGWFAAKNVSNPLKYIGILALIIFIIYLGISRIQIDSRMLCFMLCGFTIGMVLAHYLNEGFSEFPVPLKYPTKKVVFDATHKPLRCIQYNNSEVFMQEDSYDTFLFDLARSNIVEYKVHYKGKLQDALKDASALAIITPRKKFTGEELKVIKEFVKAGHGLLLIEGPDENTTINQVARMFGLEFRVDPVLSIYLISVRNLINPTPIDAKFKENYSLNLKNSMVKIPEFKDKNSAEILLTFRGMPYAVVTKYGKGTVLAIGDDLLFTIKNPGYFMKKLRIFVCEMMEALAANSIEMVRNLQWHVLELDENNTHEDSHSH